MNGPPLCLAILSEEINEQRREKTYPLAKLLFTMEDYIGEIVLVTLRNPPNTQVRGLVSGIVDFQLCLRDGKLLYRIQVSSADGSL